MWPRIGPSRSRVELGSALLLGWPVWVWASFFDSQTLGFHHVWMRKAICTVYFLRSRFEPSPLLRTVWGCGWNVKHDDCRLWPQISNKHACKSSEVLLLCRIYSCTKSVLQMVLETHRRLSGILVYSFPSFIKEVSLSTVLAVLIYLTMDAFWALFFSSVSINVCVYMRKYVYVCVHEYMCVQACVHVYVCKCVCTWVYMSMCVHAYT